MEGLGNLPVVIDLNNKENPTIIAIQETWLRSFKNVQFAETMRSHRWIFKNADSQLNEEDKITMRNLSFHGVALGISEEWAEKAEEIQVDHRNIIAVKIKVKEEEIILINAYLPTRGKDKEYEEAIDAIKTTLEFNANGNQKIVIMGDTNTDEKSTWKRKRAWNKLLQEFSLTDIITGQRTHFHHASGAEGELDRFITRGYIPKVTILDSDLSTSDHRPILAEVNIQVQEEKTQKLGAPVETKVSLERLKESEELFKEATNRLADEIRTWRDNYTLDSQNGLISSMIYQTAIEITGQKMYQSQKVRKKKRYKIDRELRKGLRTARKNYKSQKIKSKKTPEYRRIKHYKKLIKNQIMKQREEEEWSLNAKIIEATRERSSKVFGLLKKIKQETVNENKLPSWIEGYGMRFDAPDVLEGMRELFRQQTTIDYCERFDEDRFQVSQDVVEEMRKGGWSEEEYGEITISEEQFEKLVDKMKSGKAQDFTGMSNDLLKMSGRRMKNLIYDITSESLQERCIGGRVRNFGKGTIIIKKPGKPTTIIKNWRKIVCNNTILNLLQLHVQPRIEKKAQQVQTRCQLGFTRGIPVSNAVIAREEIQQISRCMKRTLFLGVLDLQSCFPRICREEMLILSAEILEPAEWDVISQIYENTWGELRVAGQKSRPARGDIGTIEGGVLSVQILKIYIGVLLKMLIRAGFTSGVDFRLKIIKSGQIGVADDVILYVWNAEKMRVMLHICQIWSDRFRATFSADKSVIVIQRAPGDETDYGKFFLNGQELKIVKTAEHLGLPIEDTGDNTETLVTERMMKTRRAINASMSMFDQKSFVPAAIKLQVWRTQYRYILIYGLDMSNLKVSQIIKIETFQMKVLRAIFNLSKRASNTKLRLLTGMTTMSHEIWKNRYGALNNILIGDTIVKNICLFAYYNDMKISWTYKTIKYLHDTLKKEDCQEIQALQILTKERKEYKEDIKNLMMGIERRKLLENLRDQDIYKLPSEPFKYALPLTNTGFNHKLQRELKHYAALYTGDFFRNYRGACYLCSINGLSGQTRITDDTRHALSGQCVVDESPGVRGAWADVKMIIQTMNENSEIIKETCEENKIVKFLLDPTNIALDENRITPENLQLSGLDNKIRKLISEKYLQRYKLLRKHGLINRKKQ